MDTVEYEESLKHNSKLHKKMSRQYSQSDRSSGSVGEYTMDRTETLRNSVKDVDGSDFSDSLSEGLKSESAEQAEINESIYHKSDKYARDAAKTAINHKLTTVS